MDEDSDEPFYEVEKILNHRKKASGTGYDFYLKWKGYPDSQNSWEPEENVTPDLIEPYLSAVHAKEKRKSLKKEIKDEPLAKIPPIKLSKAAKAASESVRSSKRSRKVPSRLSPELTAKRSDEPASSDENITDPDKLVKDLFKGLTPEKIGGICIMKNKPHFKMVWKDDPRTDLIPMKTCNRLYPQEVIAYYEHNLKFTDNGKK